MYFDEDGSTFFSYIIGQGTFELDPEVVAFLAAKLDYRVGDDRREAARRQDHRRPHHVPAARRRSRQHVPAREARRGPRRHRDPRRRGVGRVEPAGAAEWRSFVAAWSTPLVEQLYLVGVAAGVPREAVRQGRPRREGAGRRLHAAVRVQLVRHDDARSTIDVAEHHEVLKFATAPELRCTDCKAAMQCAASEALMTVLPTLPKPRASPRSSQHKIGELRGAQAREEARPASAASPASREARPRASPASCRSCSRRARSSSGGRAAARVPAHGRQDGARSVRLRAGGRRRARRRARRGSRRPRYPGAAGCTRQADQRPVVHRRVARARRARTRPRTRRATPRTRRSRSSSPRQASRTRGSTGIAPTILETRAATLAAFSRDPLSTQARRDLHEGRHAVAHVHREGRAASRAGRYWEAFDGTRWPQVRRVRAGDDARRADVAQAARGLSRRKRRRSAPRSSTTSPSSAGATASSSTARSSPSSSTAAPGPRPRRALRRARGRWPRCRRCRELREDRRRRVCAADRARRRAAPARADR